MVAAAGARVALGEAAGDVAESRVTILDRGERVCVSLDDRDRAGMPIRSNRRVTKRMTRQSVSPAAWIEQEKGRHSRT